MLGVREDNRGLWGRLIPALILQCWGRGRSRFAEGPLSRAPSTLEVIEAGDHRRLFIGDRLSTERERRHRGHLRESKDGGFTSTFITHDKNIFRHIISKGLILKGDEGTIFIIVKGEMGPLINAKNPSRPRGIERRLGSRLE